jgi:hypothetical protein
VPRNGTEETERGDSMLKHISGWIESGRFYIAVTDAGLPVGILIPVKDGIHLLSKERAYRAVSRDSKKGVAAKV